MEKAVEIAKFEVDNEIFEIKDEGKRVIIVNKDKKIKETIKITKKENDYIISYSNKNKEENKDKVRSFIFFKTSLRTGNLLSGMKSIMNYRNKILKHKNSLKQQHNLLEE
ncbi:MAG: hypothetical protein ACRC4M_04900 [Mycoplasma sp.]